MMIIRILKMYNSKHPRTWDSNFLYVKHNENKTIHNYIGHNSFRVCLRFHPLAPIDVYMHIVLAR